ncbi:MAG: hypothetical protein A2137_06645 [Chloroflexi bacterium RBG_16_58_8]|nr:MAG: hypothetical protein A2137_06645 [Chloroflexi bacterium RBG_16_58_8]
MVSLKNIDSSPDFTRHLASSRAFEGKPLVIVDVGARGGFAKYWSCYGDQIKLIGFEPDAEECEQLNRQAAGSGNRYFPVALHQNTGRKTFYITAYPPSSGFNQPIIEEVGRFTDKVNLSVVRTIEMETIDFDSFAGNNNIDYVDFIKLDTEGAELDILKGARQYLKKSVLGLSVEVGFQKWHRDQPVFCDIDSFLRPIGFKLFDLAINRSSREALPPLTHSPIPGPAERGQISFGQALYLRDGAYEIASSKHPGDGWDDTKVLKLASFMELFCLTDCAIELIQAAKNKGLLQAFDTDRLIDLLVPPLGKRKVSYREYLESVRVASLTKPPAGGAPAARAKRLAVRWLPEPLRRVIRVCLTRLRDTIDGMIK